jgi:GNAT superfamily N-acetyltransferase
VDDLIRRPYGPVDAPAVTALLNRTDEAAGGHPTLTVDYVESLLRAAIRDPAADTRLVLTPGGELVAAAMTATPPDGGFRIDLLGGVDPRWCGRGLGRELLGWQVARAAEIHRAVAQADAWRLHTGAVAGDEPRIRLLRRFGFTPVRYWFQMTASVRDAPTGAPAPASLRIVPYRAGYEQDVYEAHMEVFADHWGYQRRAYLDWVSMTVRSTSFAPEFSVVAFDGDEIAGYVLSYHDVDPARVYIGQVGTRRAWRRRGVAFALLTRVLDAARVAGRGFAALDVDADSPTGAVGLYERAGFAVGCRTVTYALPLAGRT